MKIESEKVDLSEPKFDDVNLPSSGFHNINLAGVRVDEAYLAGVSVVHGQQDRARIDGIAVTALLAYWRAGHGAKSA